MIKEFITGRWYRCIVNEHQGNWADEMDGVLDGKPHLCIRGSGQYATFDVAPRDNGEWVWGLNEFEEAPSDDYIDEWEDTNQNEE